MWSSTFENSDDEVFTWKKGTTPPPSENLAPALPGYEGIEQLQSPIPICTLLQIIPVARCDSEVSSIPDEGSAKEVMAGVWTSSMMNNTQVFHLSNNSPEDDKIRSLEDQLVQVRVCIASTKLSVNIEGLQRIRRQIAKELAHKLEQKARRLSFNAFRIRGQARLVLEDNK